MEYLALYRKYRPNGLDEVVDQTEIKQILASSVANRTITHAYLFSGPRGTGKTTMAKILAKMVNCEAPVDGNACNKCKNCLNILNSSDVIEIDAASNNGVDEIRDLREKANLVPSTAKYKVYIIDEVHMLTTQAFNALLKTLEEPPKHVIFILATTEYYKIPLTITSRCQKFQFSKISIEGIVDRLREIAKNEKIKIDDDALYEIAKISDGGMRDSINFLDQLRSFNSEKITIEDVYDVCGNVSDSNIVKLLADITNSNAENITAFFEEMDNNGKNYSKFILDFVSFLKDVLLYKNNVNKKYLHSGIEHIKKAAGFMTVDNIFLMIEILNDLIDKLKIVSRQSVMVIANFLLIASKISNAVVDRKYKNNAVTDISTFSVDIKSDIDKDLHEDVGVNENLHVVNNGENVDENGLDSIFANENKEILINNAFAVANKNLKNDLQRKFSNISDYLTDKKYKSIVGQIVDVKIEVAGENYIIFSCQNAIIRNKIYSNYKLCAEFFDMLFGSKYNFVIITTEEWYNYRDNYINSIRNGKKYELINIDANIQIIDENKENNLKEATVVDKLFELIGEDSVEFK